jgi:hypothetical protein
MILLIVVLFTSCSTDTSGEEGYGRRLTRSESNQITDDVHTNDEISSSNNNVAQKPENTENNNTNNSQENDNTDTIVENVPFPDNTIFYQTDDNLYFFDGLTGEMLYSQENERYFIDNEEYVDIYDNYLRFYIPAENELIFDYIYKDRNGLMVIRPENAPKVYGEINGITIFRDGNFYGLADSDKDIIVDAIYNELEGNEDYSLFKFQINNTVGVIDNKGNYIVKPNSYNYNSLIINDKNIICRLNGEYNDIRDMYSLNGDYIGRYRDLSYLGDNHYFIYTSESMGEIIDLNGKTIISEEKLNTKYSIIESRSGNTKEPNSFIIKPKNDISKMFLGMEVTEYDGYNVISYTNILDTNGDSIFSITDYNLESVYLGDGYFITNWYDFSKDIMHKSYIHSIDSPSQIVEITNSALIILENGMILDEDSNKLYSIDKESLKLQSLLTTDDYEVVQNSIIVSDATGTFWGLAVEDGLFFPFDYTDYEIINDDKSIICLIRGNTRRYIITSTCVEINLPDY